MGLVYADLEIASAATPSDAKTVRARVDAGATLSVFLSSMLDKLGVQRIGRRQFLGFNGAVVREIGGLVMRYENSVAGVTVIFGAEDDPPTMGATALGSLGYQADPSTGQLNRVEMLML